jgi:hypothetical protein
MAKLPVGLYDLPVYLPGGSSLKNLVKEEPVFSETETDWLISSKPLDDLPRPLQEKLKESGLGE